VSKRSYDQPGCGLATALDLLGQRWTLLIVRELMVGPLRYTDMLARLNGIGTNLLAARLRQLEETAVLERHELPPPAASVVYELTERGRQLEPILTGLATWGQQFVDDATGVELDARREAFALHCAFRPERARHVDDLYQFEVESAVMHARVRDGQLETGLGPIPYPRAVMRFDRLTWTALLRGEAGDLCPTDGGMEVEGDPAAARRALRVFGRPGVLRGPGTTAAR
jgi:DNA-binding HxlR family transcriptional regulator